MKSCVKSSLLFPPFPKIFIIANSPTRINLKLIINLKFSKYRRWQTEIAWNLPFLPFFCRNFTIIADHRPAIRPSKKRRDLLNFLCPGKQRGRFELTRSAKKGRWQKGTQIRWMVTRDRSTDGIYARVSASGMLVSGHFFFFFIFLFCEIEISRLVD